MAVVRDVFGGRGRARVAAGVAVGLVVSLAPQSPVFAAPARGDPSPAPAADRSVPVSAVRVDSTPLPAMPAAAVTAPVWPVAGSALVNLAPVGTGGRGEARELPGVAAASAALVSDAIGGGQGEFAVSLARVR